MRLSMIGFVTLCLCGPASAINYTFTGNGSSSGDWATAANWSPSRGPPTYGDHALIPSGKLCTVDDGAAADTVEVESTAELRLNAALTLYGDFAHSAGGTSVIDGTVTIYEEHFTPIYGQLIFSNYSHLVQGTGAIEGHGGRLRIIGTTLWSELATSGKGIRGSSLRIEGQPVSGVGGEFQNWGLVDVDGDGARIELQYATTLGDVSSSKWRIANCGTLAFYKEATGLAGDFVSGGVSPYFEFHQTVKTCGRYTRNGSGITLSSAKTFEYLYFSTGAETCGGDPGSNPCSSPGCTCKTVVYSSVGACGTSCSD